jgi:hypothetical protein
VAFQWWLPFEVQDSEYVRRGRVGCKIRADVAVALEDPEVFVVTPEDERYVTLSHCELTAVHATTGEAYSVEAKSRHRASYLGQPGAPTRCRKYKAMHVGCSSLHFEKKPTTIASCLST